MLLYEAIFFVSTVETEVEPEVINEPPIFSES